MATDVTGAASMAEEPDRSRANLRLLLVEPAVDSDREIPTRHAAVVDAIEAIASRRGVAVTQFRVTDRAPERLMESDLRGWVLFGPGNKDISEQLRRSWSVVERAAELEDHRILMDYTARSATGDASMEAMANDFAAWLDNQLGSYRARLAQLTLMLETIERSLAQLLDDVEEVKSLADRLQMENEDLRAQLQHLQSLVGSLRARLSSRAIKAIAQFVLYVVTTVVAVGATPPAEVAVTLAEAPHTAALVDTCKDVIRELADIDS